MASDDLIESTASPTQPDVKQANKQKLMSCILWPLGNIEICSDKHSYILFFVLSDNVFFGFFRGSAMMCKLQVAS